MTVAIRSSNLKFAFGFDFAFNWGVGRLFADKIGGQKLQQRHFDRHNRACYDRARVLCHSGK